MNLEEQLANLVGQEVVLSRLCWGIISTEPIGKLGVLPSGTYYVGQCGFSGKYVTEIDGNHLLFNWDLQSEDAVEEMCQDPDYAAEPLAGEEEAMRQGEAHMKDLREMGWEG